MTDAARVYYLLTTEERRLAVWALQCLLFVTVEAAHTRDDLKRAGALLVRLNSPDLPGAMRLDELGLDRYLDDAREDA
jgi:hypothetical protein